ncbi:hypothetical protein [Sagittula salina]|uniref:Uncharacterized protein n=1 Tax=Sagittula salina TaxID=2820268 RepID=A0A940S2P3_9RHOB|nr:hypothetical protein [Sagittula salina]MBP0481895.1 hypothetical protein [Sagittula salina]
MPSLFSIPTQAPGVSLPPRALNEVERTPPAQSRNAASGVSYGDATQGAGAPAATGAVNAPSAVQPQPAAAPPVSTSQAGRLTAAVISLQAKGEAREAKDEQAAEVQAQDARTEAVRQSAEPRGTDQEYIEFEGNRDDVRSGNGPAEALTEKGPEDEGKATREAVEQYRDANETTSAAEPARQLMSA